MKAQLNIHTAPLNVFRHVKNAVWGYVLLIILPGIICCSGSLSNYGLITPSERVAGEFARFNVTSEYRYYSSGSALYPNAILGLRKELRLDPRTLWKEVAMTPLTMKELVGAMQTKVFGLGLYLYGFELTTPDGSPVGSWYSIPTARTLLRMNEDGTIWIETPDIDTYEKFEFEMDRD
jgi:hypothetical protein